MKALKLGLVIMAAALITVGLGGLAYAYHSGGVAECAGCHSMHSSAGEHLLISADASSTCLYCHERTGQTGPSSYHIATPENDLVVGTAPIQRSPGGDFGWLKKNYSWTAHGESETEDGSSHGHSIVAAGAGQDGITFNYTPDSEHTQAPGGTFSSSQLGCGSCHDPHGTGRRLSDGTYSASGPLKTGSGSTGTIPPPGESVGTYRLLAGPYYTGAAGVTFNAWPIAVSPSSYNRTEAVTQTRVAYGAQGGNTWGQWCGSCHPAMLTTGIGTSGHTHPVDQALGSSSGTAGYNYNHYVKTGDFSGTFGPVGTGTPGPFTSLVPFAEATDDITTLKSHAKNDDTYLNGPGSNDTVICLSCHRAHASGWEHALRWNTEETYIISAGAYPTDMGRTALETQGAYYDRPASVFAAYQKSLCNKCHAKD